MVGFVFRFLVVVLLSLCLGFEQRLWAKQVCSIEDAILLESSADTPQLSTAEFKKAIKDGVLVLDNRPYMEWAISHIPGAIVVAPKPGVSKALYTSDVVEVKRIVNDDKSKSIVLYCDGIHCGKSKRIAKDLMKEGFTNVSRYQLGIPVWRSLGNITQCEIDGIKYIYENDKTAWFIDSRKADSFAKYSLKGSKNIPFDGVMDGKDVGEIFKAKEDGRLPVDDRNTRIIVFGENIDEIKRVADGLVKEAFHNVCFYAGALKDILNLDKKNEGDKK